MQLDLFHSCALAAYVDIAREQRTPKPDSNSVKRRAYQYYEQELRRG